MRAVSRLVSTPSSLEISPTKRRESLDGARTSACATFLRSKADLELVQHQIDHNSSHTHIQPNRQRPPRNPPMPNKICTQRPPQSNNGQPRHTCGQNCMRNQNCVVHNPNRPTL